MIGGQVSMGKTQYNQNLRKIIRVCSKVGEHEIYKSVL